MINPAVRNSIRGSGRQAYPHQVARALPRAGLLLYLSAPNSTGKFLLPADADIRAATGWVSGVGNIFYDAAGDPVAVLASEIAAWSSINQWNVLFHLVSADTETGRLAIYSMNTPITTLNKALRVLREDQIDLTPTAYFNGVFTPAQIAAEGGTYTGGPTVFADNLGVLKTAPSGVPALQGMRLATTVADGAVLGPELVVNGDFINGTTGWTVIAATLSVVAGALRVTKVSANGQARSSFPTVAGSLYQLIFSLVNRTNTTVSTYFQVGSAAGATDVINESSGFGLTSLSRTITFTAKSSTTYITLYSSSATGYEEWDNISIKEVIPIYFDTTLDGTPLLPSVPQPTRTFDVGFTTSVPGPTYKKYARANPAVDLPGYLCEPARTNKVTCRKANPVDLSGLTKSGDTAAILSVVDDTAALTAAGLIGICNSGKVYKLDNSAGVGFAFASPSGPAGNTSAHSLSVYARKSGGSAFLKFYGDVAQKYIPVSTGYIKTVHQNVIPGSSSSTLELAAGAGSVIYFILPQLEEGPFCTSPIAKLADGSEPLTAITRQGTVLSYPTAGKIRSNNMAFRMIVVPRATGQGCWLFSSNFDAGNYTAINLDPTVIKYRKRLGGVITVDASVSFTHTNNVPFDIIFLTYSTLGMRIAVRSFTGGAWSAWTNGAFIANAEAKANSVLGSAYSLGTMAASQFTGNISELDTLLIPEGITDPLAWAKAQWRLPA